MCPSCTQVVEAHDEEVLVSSRREGRTTVDETHTSLGTRVLPLRSCPRTDSVRNVNGPTTTSPESRCKALAHELRSPLGHLGVVVEVALTQVGLGRRRPRTTPAATPGSGRPRVGPRPPPCRVGPRRGFSAPVDGVPGRDGGVDDGEGSVLSPDW